MLRRAWVGYQRRLDAAMADAGFGDRVFPDARVLRLCHRDETTISAIGRELGISRQGAAKVVAALAERGYVKVEPSATSGREKVVTVTDRAERYLSAQRAAARRIDQQLRRRLGGDGFDTLRELCDALAPEGDDVRLRDYLRQKGLREL
jgi:DNA-binding MarR family transcriptional regulator